MADLCSSLGKWKHLTTLYIKGTLYNEPLHLNSLSSCPQFLQNLHLNCRLATLPKWIASLKYLTKLVLQESYLNDDPLKLLQGLPNLGLLKLRYAYEGEELRCNVGGYPRLKKLELEERTKAIEEHKSEGRSKACVQGTIYQIM
ncbi:hypothetical protein CsSME_00037018 [Camellia sinensis var. sinensis]